MESESIVYGCIRDWPSGDREQHLLHDRTVVPHVPEQQADENEATLDPLVRAQELEEECQLVHRSSGKYRSQNSQPRCGNHAGIR